MYNLHVDPGHAWIEVPFQTLVELGITDKISEYSYRFQSNCYLEEDCDGYLFIHRFLGKYGVEPTLVTVHHDLTTSPPCFIRDLDRYRKNW